VPYSVTIEQAVQLAIMSWGLPKTTRDQIVHHLTEVLPSNPDLHLAEAIIPLANTFSCPLHAEDPRPGREGRQILFLFAVRRNDAARTLVVVSGRIAEQEPEGWDEVGDEE
jgi:hypothetical protein